MSSINPFASSLVLAIVASTHIYAQNTAPATLTCPATIDVTETPSPVPGWQTATSVVNKRFQRVSIFNADSGGREFDLAPDDQNEERGRTTQTWKLKGYRTMHLFLRCRYNGTPVVLTKDIPAAFQTCALSFFLEKGGAISKPSFACR